MCAFELVDSDPEGSGSRRRRHRRVHHHRQLSGTTVWRDRVND
jgi:hypothetical protein